MAPPTVQVLNVVAQSRLLNFLEHDRKRRYFLMQALHVFIHFPALVCVTLTTAASTIAFISPGSQALR